MRTIILTILIALNFISSPQTVGKIQHVSCDKVEDNYVVSYRDYNYFQITVNKNFQLTQAEFDFLKVVIKGSFKEVPEEPVQIETLNDILILKFTKVMGVVNLQITQLVDKNPKVKGVTKYLTKRSASKLFGIPKKKK